MPVPKAKMSRAAWGSQVNESGFLAITWLDTSTAKVLATRPTTNAHAVGERNAHISDTANPKKSADAIKTLYFPSSTWRVRDHNDPLTKPLSNTDTEPTINNVRTAGS